jgi:hypothetical protein
MWTINYRGYFIHGYCNQNACDVMDNNGLLERFKSLQSAKSFITKYLVE